MKKAKAPRVPVLENAFEVNLSKLMRAAKVTGSSRLLLDDGDVRTVAVLAETRLAVLLGGQQWVAEIVEVPCLKGRLRPLLKCPRAHEGNFQSLYFRNGELACRHCHALRYRTNLAATSVDRLRITRRKLIASLGTEDGELVAERQPSKWRSRHLRFLTRLTRLNNVHYKAVRNWLERKTVTSTKAALLLDDAFQSE